MSSAKSMFVSISTGVLNQVSETYKKFGLNITEQLSKKYGFDMDDAITELGMNELSIIKKKVSASKKSVAPKKTKIPLPFTGVINDDDCMGIRVNNFLHTQCANKPTEGNSYCSACQKQADANASGKPNMGNIHDRLECELLDFVDPKNRKTLPYINVINKLKLDIDTCKAEAERLGIEIPDCHFIERVSGKGRPKKTGDDATVSSVDSGEKKPRGRPQKKEVVSAVGDDLLTAIVANTVSKPETVPEKTEKKPVKRIKKKVVAAQVTPAPADDAKVEQADDADAAEAAEAEKAKILKSTKAAEAKAKRDAKAKAKAEAEAKAKAEAEAEAKAKAEAEAKAKAEEQSQELEEEEEVEEFIHKGKKYYKDADNIIYDFDDQSLVGEYNPEKDEIEECEFAEDSD